MIKELYRRGASISEIARVIGDCREQIPGHSALPGHGLAQVNECWRRAPTAPFLAKSLQTPCQIGTFVLYYRRNPQRIC